MDARSLSQAAQVQVGTLNAWIQRGLIPGVTADARGRLRDFDIKTAAHIGIMAELSRFGFGAPLASAAARFALSASAQRCLFSNPVQEGPIGEVGQRFGFSFLPFESEATLSKTLAEAGADQLPSVSLIVNIERITATMQQAEKEWQLRRKTRPARKTDG